MEMTDAVVSIPNTTAAKEALDKTVVKIIKAHRAEEFNKGNKSPSVRTAEKDTVKDDKPVIADCLKPFTISDVKKIIEDNDIKLGGGKGRKADSFYFEGVSKLDNVNELVDAYKLSIANEFS